MESLTAEKISAKIDEIEQRIGRLSPMQKILIGTDGSVTNLLEMVSGHPITITTRVQEIVSADGETAAALDIEPGERVNYRVVELKDSVTGEVLIYAVSRTPLRRLAPEFRIVGRGAPRREEGDESVLYGIQYTFTPHGYSLCWSSAN